MNRFKTILAVMLLTAACQIPQEGPSGGNEEERTERLTVLSPTVTKTVMGEETDAGYPVYWCDGDRIMVNGKRSEPLYGIEEKAGEAEFEIDGVAAPFHLVYPSWICSSMDGQTARIELPVTQKWEKGSFGNGSAVLYGASAEDKIEMKNLCGVVNISFDFGEYDITDILLTSLGEAVSGTFALDTESGKLEAVEGFQSVRIDRPEGGYPESSFNFAVPAAAYSEGFNIVVTEAGGRQMAVALRQDCEVLPGVIKFYPRQTFEPEGSLIITDAESWNRFALAANQGDWSEWQDPESGAVKMAGNIVTGGDLTQISNWNGLLDCGGYSITRGVASRPLFDVIGAEGSISNLVLDGGHAESAEASFASLATVNLGTVINCENRMGVDLAVDSDFFWAGLVESNGGLLRDCVNSAEVKLQLPLSANRAFSLGAIALTACAEGICGTFENCTNRGDIIIIKNAIDESDLQKCSIGGIAAYVEQGDSENYVTFRGCSNEARIQLWENTWANSPNGAYFIGGILGRACLISQDMNGNKSWYLTFNKPCAHIVLDSCSNSGVIDVCCSNTSTVGKNMSGARQCYVAGIAGAVTGLAAAPAEIISCTNTGALMTGGSTRACTIAGGICGGAGYADFKSCSCSGTFSLTSSTEVSPVGPGSVAGIASHILPALLPVKMSGCTCTSEMPAGAISSGALYSTGGSPTIE